MKYLLLIFLNCCYAVLPAQDNTANKYLHTTGKRYPYYIIEQGSNKTIVYSMGKYLDKAGVGSSMLAADTLQQIAGKWAGKTFEITRENERDILNTNDLKNRKFVLETPADLPALYTKLNNAYYLDHYFELSRQLNKTYPLNDFSFRSGFQAWDELPGNESDPEQFRFLVTEKLRYIKDSVSTVNERLVKLTNHLQQSVASIEYTPVKDSINQLLQVLPGYNRYFSSIISIYSKQKPAYFLQLAEDMPQQRALFFMAADDSKETYEGIKAVAGHDAIKKIYVKNRRSDRSMKYKVIGVYGALAGVGLYFLLR